MPMLFGALKKSTWEAISQWYFKIEKARNSLLSGWICKNIDDFDLIVLLIWYYYLKKTYNSSHYLANFNNWSICM